MDHVTSAKDYTQLLQSPMLLEEYATIAGNPYLVVDASEPLNLAAVAQLPMCPVIGLGQPNNHPYVDLFCQDEQDLAQLTGNIKKQPTAAATLVQVLRHNEHADTTQGLLAESLAYSTLQNSSGFRTWLANQTQPPPQPAQEAVLTTRYDNQLNITLNRPQVHNAYNEATKDALCQALQLAHSDPKITRVSINGNGASFCAGGDLSEFGSAADAGLAHLSRTTRSAGALLHTLTCETKVHLHGACIGAGIELPAFADFVSADPQTFFALPEVAMGLIPGAGGTVSICQRIGRHRTAHLAISSAQLGADVALAWGLIDRIETAAPTK